MNNTLVERASSATTVGDADFECGILEIDWHKRDFSIRGIGGDDDLMTPSEVLRTLRRKGPANKLRLAAVVWKENADGRQQLCFYDLGEFQRAVQWSLGTEEIDHGR